MYYGFVKCVCGGYRKVYSHDLGYEEFCITCGYSGILEIADIHVYLIRGKCKELY